MKPPANILRCLFHRTGSSDQISRDLRLPRPAPRLLLGSPCPRVQVRAPMPPVYFFAIDMSAEAASSGVLPLVCDIIKACLDRLPGDERTQIGFVTYNAHKHFYNLSAPPPPLTLPPTHLFTLVMSLRRSSLTRADLLDCSV